MRREKELFEEVVAFEALHGSFGRASAGKRDRSVVRSFELHLEEHLWEMHRELTAGTSAWGPYRRFVISDPKRREIRAAPFRDRVAHHTIVGVVDPIFERGFITDTYACIRGRGQHRAVERYRRFARARGGRGYAVHCDISGYFRSVDHGVLLGRLERRIADRMLLDLLASLITHGGEAPGVGMPIGALTSQMFANPYLDPLDHFV